MACPKGNICISMTTILIAIVVLTVFVLYYMHSYNGVASTKIDIYTEQSAGDNDALYHARITDPLLPPERSYPVNRPPIMTRYNTPSRSEPSGYQQVGALIELTTEGGQRRMLPLYGSRSTYNSNRWNYYANTDGFQSVKLPVIFKGKNCQDEFGCDEIYDNDDLNVQGFDFPYKATIYKVDRPRY